MKLLMNQIVLKRRVANHTQLLRVWLIAIVNQQVPAWVVVRKEASNTGLARLRWQTNKAILLLQQVWVTIKGQALLRYITLMLWKSTSKNNSKIIHYLNKLKISKPRKHKPTLQRVLMAMVMTLSLCPNLTKKWTKFYPLLSNQFNLQTLKC